MNKILPLVLIFPLFFFTEAISAGEFLYEPPTNFSLDVKDVALHHPVTTKQVAAQLYFDQGMSFLYGFNQEASFWSFLKASQQDPQMSMAYWGMAIALGDDINTKVSNEQIRKAWEYIQKAKELSSNSPQVEKDYIQALSTRYSKDYTDRAQLAQRYSDSMRELVKKYPDDPDAGVLYAASIMTMSPWNQWDASGNPNIGTLETIEVLESVLSEAPNHVGANHYYIHVIEDSKHPERALISAQRLSNLNSALGHIIHMGSHIYLRTGNYHESTQVNEEALAADQEYIRNYGMYGSYPVHYYTHSILYGIRSLLMESRFHEAQLLSQLLQKVYNPIFEMMSDMEYYASTELFTLILMKRWRDVLRIQPPSEKMKLTLALWRYGRAMAYTKIGIEEKALEEKQYFKKLLAADGSNNILRIAALFLDAAIAESNNDSSKVIQSLKEAILIQEKEDNQGAVDWFFPARNYLGMYLLKNDRPIEAEAFFRQDLKVHPRYGQALFRLRESLIAQQRLYDAFWVNNELEAAWKFSDFSYKNPLSF